jgi:hypothetical protein
MKNLPPSGFQGFPSLFIGLFGGAAYMFRWFIRGKNLQNPTGKKLQPDHEELKTIGNPIDEQDAGRVKNQ